MIPADLQPILWSVGVDKLDLQKDKNYIVHQVLAYGTWEHLKWLFEVYSPEEIKTIFLNNPAKDYTFPAFNFTKNILLNLQDKPIDQTLYVRSFPRNFRSK